jgi:pimeloyl-ACP methyl ester carboxylesterase
MVQGGNKSSLIERYAELGGRRLRYLEGGEGIPLVLCHGFLSSAEEFGGRFSALTSVRRLIVPDLPGNAGSAPLSGQHTADALAESVDELLTQLGVDTCDVGGLCVGASVACALARRREPAVGRLILHTPLLVSGLIRQRYRYQVSALTLPGVWQTAAWLSRSRLISDLYRRLVIQEGQVDPLVSDANFENQRRADLGAAVEWLSDSMKGDDLTLIASRTKPTLIIVSEHDNLVNVQGLRRVVNNLPHVVLYVDEHGRHGWSKGAVQRHFDVLYRFLAGAEQNV